MSISDFGKQPEEPKATVTSINLSDPDTKPAETPAPVLQEPEGKADFVVTKSDSPAPTPSGIQIVGQQPAAPTQNAEDILNDIMANIGDGIGTRSYLKCLFYGDPGSMKSSLSATAPNNLVADLEDGLVAAKFSPHGVADKVKPYPWRGFEDFSNLIGAFLSNPPELEWVETFTIDTFSEVHKRALAEVTEREWRRRPGSVNRYVPETDHHQENNERMLRMIRALRDMNRNLIILTHATTVEPKNKPAKTYPDFSEKLANKIEAMMDVVGYCEKRVIEEDGVKKLCQVVRFRTDDGVHAKTRIPLPTEMINPTMADIFRVWEESKNA